MLSWVTSDMNDKIEAGDRIVFGKCKANRDIMFTTIGKLYTVFRDEWSKGLAYRDDDGDVMSLKSIKEYGLKATKIIE